MSASATQLIARNSETTLLAAGSFVGAKLEDVVGVPHTSLFCGVMELVQLCPLRIKYMFMKKYAKTCKENDGIFIWTENDGDPAE